MNTTRIELPVRGMTCASCVARIEKGLAHVPGVHAATVNLAAERATLTYDPEQAGVEEIAKAIQELGYEVPVERLTLAIGGMSCASCVATIERELSAVPGVLRPASTWPPKRLSSKSSQESSSKLSPAPSTRWATARLQWRRPPPIGRRRLASGRSGGCSARCCSGQRSVCRSCWGAFPRGSPGCRGS
jgi:copper ion binding protein